MQPPYRRAVIGVGVLLAGALIGAALWLPKQSHDAASSAADNAAPSALASAQAETASYTCPMHPHIVQDHPGTCPICGMALVPIAHQHQSGVTVDAATQQTLGVRLATAKQRVLARNVYTYGKVGIDQGSIVYVTPKFEGWVRKLHVTTVGQRVKEGDVLYELYSADLIARQSDYLKMQERRRQLLKMVPQVEGQESELVMDLMQERTRARTRMVYEDVDPQTLKDLEDANQPLLVVPIRAPRDGLVTEIDAREGSFVAPEGKIVALASLDEVWIDIVLFEDQLTTVHEGDALTATIPAVGGVAFAGKLTWASPLLDETARTARARLQVSNADARLRPGMYADVTIETHKDRRLVVPRSAVLRSGAGDFVMRHGGDGHFLPTAVQIGLEAGNWTEIRDGLNDGDQVAANGQFLLSAEASLADARQRMATGVAVSEDRETEP